MTASLVRKALIVGLIAASATACSGETAQADADKTPTVAPKVAAELLLLGSGETCQDDRGCGPSPTRGACVLGTCFGLLKADSPAARSVILERLAHVGPDVRAEIKAGLIKVASAPEAQTRTRIAAAEGLGMLVRRLVDGACDDVCKLLRHKADSSLPEEAAAARHGLVRAGDVSVVDAVLVDLAEGTPHMQCAAAGALAGLSATTEAASVAAALRQAAKSDDAAVRAAAERALRTWEKG